MENSYFGPDALLAKLAEDSPKLAMEVLGRCKEQQMALRNARSGEIRVERKDVLHFYAIKGDGKGERNNINGQFVLM